MYFSIFFLLFFKVLSDDLKCHQSYYTRPFCSNHPNGYHCTCGPGFIWNNKVCVAAGLNSTFKFDNSTDSKYVLLENKQFPNLKNFTIAFWLKPKSGTIMSYSYKEKINLLSINFNSNDNRLSLILGGCLTKPIERISKDVWSHVAWTWMKSDKPSVCNTCVYFNATLLECSHCKCFELPDNGNLVLGQEYNKNGGGAQHQTINHDQIEWNAKTSYKGDIAFVNIWERALARKSIIRIKNDCRLNECGDGIEWADFRSGTRGPINMVWPANVPFENGENCLTGVRQANSCEDYCTATEGAQCNSEIASNVLWPRSPENLTIIMNCPGSSFPFDYENDTRPIMANASRLCGSEGIWFEPNITNCLSGSISSISNMADPLVLAKSSEKPLYFLKELLRLSKLHSYDSPLDIGGLTSSFQNIILAQKHIIEDPSWTKYLQRTDKLYPNSMESRQFIQTAIEIIDNLISSKNILAWNTAIPIGIEGDALMLVLESFIELCSDSIFHHEMTALSIDKKLNTVVIEKNHISYNSKLINKDDCENMQVLFRNIGYVKVKLDCGQFKTDIVITIISAPLAQILPNRMVRSKRNKVNSNIFGVFIKERKTLNEKNENFVLDNNKKNNNNNNNDDNNDNNQFNSSLQIDFKFYYLNNFNISEVKCVKLTHAVNSLRTWWWKTINYARSNFQLNKFGICNATSIGWYAVTSHMYNDKWVAVEKPLELLLVPSYIGCAVSSILCILACLLHAYARTTSQTASIHKNLAISIAFSQITLVFGIDKLNDAMICKGVAVLLHYFFMTTFSWLMNEAFNLYIIITYTAHSHNETSNDTGSQWRYYILGWSMPAVLVGAFIGTYADDYYSTEMCFVAWHHKWIWIGPATTLLAITVLVLTFTAKEQHESAYSKNEKTNKIIFNHSKAIWSQVILLTMTWIFAFISLKMVGQIVKWLYALFNCLQGSFFFVFFSLLHDEVRTVLIAKNNNKSGKNDDEYGEYSPTKSDSDYGLPLPLEMDDLGNRSREINRGEQQQQQQQTPTAISPVVLSEDTEPDYESRRFSSTLSRRKNLSKSNASGVSECEIMVTSV